MDDVQRIISKINESFGHKRSKNYQEQACHRYSKLSSQRHYNLLQKFDSNITALTKNRFKFQN